MTITVQEIRALDYVRRPEDVAAYLGIDVERVRKVRGVAKACVVCSKPFRQGLREQPHAFRDRKCCSVSCAGKMAVATKPAPALSWCPADRIDEYRRLVQNKKLRAADARAVIEADMRRKVAA